MSQRSDSQDEDEKYWYQSKVPTSDLFNDTGGLEDLINATKELASLNKTRLDLIEENTGIIDVQTNQFQSAAESSAFSLSQSGNFTESNVQSARYNYAKRPNTQSNSTNQRQHFPPTNEQLYDDRQSVQFEKPKQLHEYIEGKYVADTFLPSSFYDPCELDREQLDYVQIVTDIMLNRPMDLSLVKSKVQKEHLLKTSIRIGDGNVIYPVLLHLRNTMSPNIFYSLLNGKSWLRGKEAQIACDHYVNYLKLFEDSQMITRELQNLGLLEEAMKYHMNEFNKRFRSEFENLVSKNSTTSDDMVSFIGGQYKSLLTILGGLKDVQYGKLISQHMFFLDVKKRLFHDLGKVNANNTYFQLLAKTNSPLDIVKFTLLYPKFTMDQIGMRFGISDRQLAFAQLESFADQQHWKELDHSIISQGLGKRLSKNSTIPWIVIAEVASKCPKDMLTHFIRHIPNPELKFECAERHECYELAVETLAVDIRDRSKLDVYRVTIPRENPAYMKAIHYLSNMPVSTTVETPLTSSGVFNSAIVTGAEMASGFNAVWKKERYRIKDFFHRKQ